jgi:membrane-associated phospholipid phosphatase
MRLRRAVLVSVVAATLGTVSSTHATEPSPFEASPAVEIPILVAVGLGAMLPRLLLPETAPTSCLPDACDAEEVNSFDRWAIGKHSKTAKALSDAAFYGSLALPYALSALDVATGAPPDGAEGWAKDNLVLLESMMFTLATANALQFVFARARPLVYDAEHFSYEERSHASHMLSFPAGHVAANVAMATTYGWIFARRHPDSPWIAPVFALGYATATLNGTGRVLAGEHFPTDVLVGVGLGAAIGIAVPLLHERRPFALTSGGAGWPALRLDPFAAGDAFGATLVAE